MDMTDWGEVGPLQQTNTKTKTKAKAKTKHFGVNKI